MITNPNQLKFWEEVRDPRKNYKTEPPDIARYTANQACYENGWNFVDEENPRSGKTEGSSIYGPAWWLAQNPNFRFGMVTHNASVGARDVNACADILEKLGFEFDYRRQAEFKLKGGWC